MLQQIKALTVCIGVVAAGQTFASPPKSHREPTSYCAYELGANLVVEAINDRNQIAGSAILGDRAQAFVWDWNRGVRLLGLLPEAAISIGNDINDRGEVVGFSGGGGILQQAFVWDRRHGMQRIVALGGQSTSVLIANDVGDLMGLGSTTAEDGEHMYFQGQDGEVVDLGGGIPFGMNDFGQVGYSRQTEQFPQVSTVFVWHPKTGEEQLSGFPDDRLIFPSAINNRMDIVGSAARDGLPRAMRWTPRKGMQFLASDEPSFSQANAVNEWGTAVGYMDAGFPVHPFVWTEKSGLRDLTTLIHPTSPTTLQAELMEARGVNDREWIAIHASDRIGGSPKGYVLTPKYRGDVTPCAAPPPVSN